MLQMMLKMFAQAAPPSGFPFYGLTPAMLRAMGSPVYIHDHVMTTIDSASQKAGFEKHQQQAKDAARG